MTPVEIKSGQTIGSDYFRGLTYWNEIAKTDPENGYIIYGGSENQSRSKGNIINWRSAGQLIKKIQK